MSVRRSFNWWPDTEELHHQIVEKKKIAEVGEGGGSPNVRD